MFIVILILSLILAFLIAYTMNMQGTTLALGRLLVSVHPEMSNFVQGQGRRRF
jgi:hypothetical protein